MSRFNFKGDINQVSERQLAYIGEVLEKRGVKGSEVLLEPVGKDGENYAANVKRITVHEDGKIIKMIVKVAPTQEKVRQIANAEFLFCNEHIIYTEVLEKFDQLQIEAGVPKKEIFRHPECYGSLSEQPHEVILLEDLKQSNFDIADRFKPMSTECVNITLKNFAKFHSLSYVLKYLEPETYRTLTSRLRDTMSEHMALIDNANVLFERLETIASDCVSEDKYKNVIKGTASEIFSIAEKCIKSDKNSKYSVIRQGDGWSNNIMFRMKNNFPEECVIIDYQMAYECSPAYDIMYMLFNSTDHEQRLKHYHKFIDLYHTELDKSLHYFGLKADFVYPREQLDADFKRYSKFAFAMSIVVSSIITKSGEEAALMKKSLEDGVMTISEIPEEIFAQDTETSDMFKKKIEDLVHSFLEFGLLSGQDDKV